jgi:uncharacterized membrane protein
VVLPGNFLKETRSKRKIRNRVSCSLFAERQNTDKPVNYLENHALVQFRKEIRQFYLVCILNLVFAALAMAFGIGYMISAILGLTTGLLSPPGLAMLIGAVALACFGLGLSWLFSTLRIFEGVDDLHDKLAGEGSAITDNRITCLIVQMLALYRDNRTTIATMIRACTFGGVCFFGLGIGTSLEAVSILSNGITFTVNNLLVIPAMLLTLGIAVVSLLSSWYFSKFAKVWDRRLHEIDESECALKKTLGLDEQ